MATKKTPAKKKTKKPAAKEQKQVELALQGGGAHGAITWGVLDRLLEDERVNIAAISMISGRLSAMRRGSARCSGHSGIAGSGTGIWTIPPPI